MTDVSTQLSVSVIIPAYGRVEPLKYTLRSAATSIRNSGYDGEIIVVDDGSEPPIEEQLAGFDAHHPVRFVRQANQGSIIARLTGLTEARGKYVQFLDSDDLLHPDKIGAQLRVMEETGCDVTYCDRSDVRLGADYTVAEFVVSRIYVETGDPAVLFTRIQPSPHSPIFRRDYLERALAKKRIESHRIMDPSGDIWLFHSLAPEPAAVRRVPGIYAGIGPHEENRFTLCWEKLALASLLIDERLLAGLESSPQGDRVRNLLGEMAFLAWRNLPHDINPDFDRRMLAIWHEARGLNIDDLGEARFRALARLIGPVNAGKLLRRLRRSSYDQCKTLRNKEEFAELLAKLPRPHRICYSAN